MNLPVRKKKTNHQKKTVVASLFKLGELAGYEEEKQIQHSLCVTEIVQRENLEQQRFQGINGKVGNGKRKAEGEEKTKQRKKNPQQKKTFPTEQVSTREGM